MVRVLHKNDYITPPHASSLVRNIIHEAVKHHGLLGNNSQGYKRLSGVATSRLCEGLRGKTVRDSLLSQVTQIALRDRGARVRMEAVKDKSIDRAGLVLAEAMLSQLASVRTELLNESDISIQPTTLVPLTEVSKEVSKRVVENVIRVANTSTGEYFDADPIEELVSAWDLDGSDGSHWIMEISSRGPRPYRGYAVTLTNPRGRVFEVAGGSLDRISFPMVKEQALVEAHSKSEIGDQDFYEQDMARMTHPDGKTSSHGITPYEGMTIHGHFDDTKHLGVQPNMHAMQMVDKDGPINSRLHYPYSGRPEGKHSLVAKMRAKNEDSLEEQPFGEVPLQGMVHAHGYPTPPQGYTGDPQADVRSLDVYAHGAQGTGGGFDQTGHMNPRMLQQQQMLLQSVPESGWSKFKQFVSRHRGKIIAGLGISAATLAALMAYREGQARIMIQMLKEVNELEPGKAKSRAVISHLDKEIIDKVIGRGVAMKVLKRMISPEAYIKLKQAGEFKTLFRPAATKATGSKTVPEDLDVEHDAITEQYYQHGYQTMADRGLAPIHPAVLGFNEPRGVPSRHNPSPARLNHSPSGPERQRITVEALHKEHPDVSPTILKRYIMSADKMLANAERSRGKDYTEEEKWAQKRRFIENMINQRRKWHGEDLDEDFRSDFAWARGVQKRMKDEEGIDEKRKMPQRSPYKGPLTGKKRGKEEGFGYVADDSNEIYEDNSSFHRGSRAYSGSRKLADRANLSEKISIYDFDERTGSCSTPGMKIKSKGKGRGLARGRGRGPLGVPVDTEEERELSLARKLVQLENSLRSQGSEAYYDPNRLAPSEDLVSDENYLDETEKHAEKMVKNIEKRKGRIHPERRQQLKKKFMQNIAQMKHRVPVAHKGAHGIKDISRDAKPGPYVKEDEFDEQPAGGVASGKFEPFNRYEILARNPRARIRKPTNREMFGADYPSESIRESTLATSNEPHAVFDLGTTEAYGRLLPSILSALEDVVPDPLERKRYARQIQEQIFRERRQLRGITASPDTLIDIIATVAETPRVSEALGKGRYVDEIAYLIGDGVMRALIHSHGNLSEAAQPQGRFLEKTLRNMVANSLIKLENLSPKRAREVASRVTTGVDLNSLESGSKQGQKQALVQRAMQLTTEARRYINEIIQEINEDRESTSEKLNGLSDEAIRKLDELHWTAEDAATFGIQFLASHGFTQRDIRIIRSAYPDMD